MSIHEIVGEPKRTFFSLEPDGNGDLRPTLWDAPGPGRKPAVMMEFSDRFEITTDRDTIAELLGVDDL